MKQLVNQDIEQLADFSKLINFISHNLTMLSRLSTQFMKHLYIFLMCISSLVSAQHFAPIGATWHYDSSLQGTRPIYGAYLYYEVVKDTVINGQECRVVKQILNSNNGNQPLSDVYVYEANDTVFYYHASLQRFSALYIFNAQQGDTLTFDVPNDFPPRNPNQLTWQVVVDSIVPMVVSGDTLRQFYTSPIVTNDTSITFYSFHRAYIERIGGTFLFLHQPHVIFPDWDGPLRCYSDTIQTINMLGIRCDSLTATSVADRQMLNDVRFYPNPANAALYLENKAEKEVSFYVYDLKGRKLMEGQVLQGKERIGLEEIPPGVYILKLFTAGVYRTERLIIQR